MNRELKFRAWDKHDNVMIDADSLAFEEYMPLVKQLNNPITVLMQYVNFKSEDGKEAYEGDIVDFWGGRGIVVLFEGEYCIEYTPDDHFGLLCDFTIIGNIFEDKHLIPKNQITVKTIENERFKRKSRRVFT